MNGMGWSVDSEHETILAALSLHQQGDLAQASHVYTNVLSHNPQNFDALHLSGLVAYQSGHFDAAELFFIRAMHIDPTSAALHLNRGVALMAMKRFADALASYDRAILVQPDYVDAYYNRGATLHDMKRHGEALVSYARAIIVKPDHAAAFNNRGTTLNDLCRHEEALADFDQAIFLLPLYHEAFFNRGFSLRQLKRPNEALVSYEKAIACKPDYAQAYNYRGVTLHELRRQDEALASYRSALSLRRDDAEAFNNHGATLFSLKLYHEALVEYEKAILIRPDDADAFNNRGNALHQLNRFDESLASLEAAITLQPASVEPRFNRGNVLRDVNRFEEAGVAYAGVLDLELQIVGVDRSCRDWLSLVYSMDFLPASHRSLEALNVSAQALDERLVSCFRMFSGIKASLVPVHAITHRFLFNLTGFYIAYLQKNVVDIMKNYSMMIMQALGLDAPVRDERVRRPGKIRLGVASGLLKSHNGANWAYNWLAMLPKDYDIFSYAFNTDADDLTRRFSELGTHRSLLFDKNNFAAAIDIMRADDLDILMLPDVGMNICSRILSCHRIAPVQFTAWGHPITTGSPNIDYFLSSDLMEPENAQSHYSETLVRLPNLALFLTAPPARKSQSVLFAFPEGRVLYGCLQSLPKYLPQYDFILPMIARKIPEALFVFLEGTPVYATAILKERLRKAFSSQGLEFNRYVRFLPPVSPDGYVDLLSRMDVILDSIGWTGGNTSLQAIELGKPIVTAPGEFMRGRHTLAMFKMMGLEEQVATSIDDYISKAIRLGSDATLRRQVGADILDHKRLLYEDHVFIDALDAFLKREFARQGA